MLSSQKSKFKILRVATDSKKDLKMNKNLVYKDKSFLSNASKTIERKNLNKNGTSLSWISILNRLNRCIIATQADSDAVLIDYDKYKEIRKEHLS